MALKCLKKTYERLTFYINTGYTITTKDALGNNFGYRILTEGNTKTVTFFDGSWERTNVEGNITIVTFSSGGWRRHVVEGNTRLTTWSSSTDWYREVVDGNTRTTTQKNGDIWKEVLDSHGNTISIYKNERTY